MKTPFVAAALLAATGLAIAYYPALSSVQDPPPPVLPSNDTKPKVEAVFVLDTTGSMGGLIQAAKDKIWSIASSMAQAQPTPEIRLGLVAYRDRGDQYVTKVVNLSTDLDSLHATLMDFKADGGGDGPESVNQALDDAVNRISWSQDPQTYKVVFLVGDAPPHMDYQDDVKYPVTLAKAKDKGILVNSIQCGVQTDTTSAWQRIAQLGNGQYFQVSQDGGAVALATPYDARLAEVAAKMDATRLGYGSAGELAEAKAKQDAASKVHSTASVESQARRAVFNSSKAGQDNFLGGKDLVEDVKSGRVDPAKLAPAALPAPVQVLAPEERQAFIEETGKQREILKKEAEDLSRQRNDYLRDKVERAGGAKESLDQKLYGAIKDQAKTKGLRYESDSASF